MGYRLPVVVMTLAGCEAVRLSTARRMAGSEKSPRVIGACAIGAQYASAASQSSTRGNR